MSSTDPVFCVRCGHACAHTPAHVLVDTTDGPICEDEAWCTQLQHAAEARSAGIGLRLLDAPAEDWDDSDDYDPDDDGDACYYGGTYRPVETVTVAGEVL